MQCFTKDLSSIDGNAILLEQNFYWLYYFEKVSLVKILNLIPQKEILFIEADLIISGNKLKIIEKEGTKKLNYNDKYLFFIFDVSQVDYLNNDFTRIPNINYPSILQILKLKSTQKNYFVRAGKITIGLNLTNENYLNYDYFSKENFNFSLDEINKTTFIVNGVPNSGKTSVHFNLIMNIFQNIKYDDSKISNMIDNKNVCSAILDKILLYLEFINLFGNCIESEYRFDSSRFMRLSKIYLKKDSKNSKKDIKFKIKFKHFLLEKSRILQNNCFLFHVFHIVINGLAKMFTNEDYLKRLNDVFPDYAKSLIEFYQDYKHFIINTSILFEDIYYNDSISKFFEEKFFVFLKIFQEIGFHKKVLIKIINIILIILLLKNLDYKEDKEGNANLDHESDNFKMIINLMNIETEEEIILFRNKLTTKEMLVGSDALQIKFKLEEAYRIKDNMIKYLYENLFYFIQQISNILIKVFSENTKNLEKTCDSIKIDLNDSEKSKSSNKDIENNSSPNNLYVQILECFGFDNNADPENNTLENLFINYANDKINNLFFDQLINNEIKLYEDEGISDKELINKIGEKYSNNRKAFENELNKKLPERRLSIKEKATEKTITRRSTITSKKNNVNFIDAMDNSEVDKTLKICEEESIGLFKLINEDTFLIKNNKGLIKSLIDKINSYWPEIKTTQNSFFLNHFGCVVEYGAKDFIYKNVENLPNELKFITQNIFRNLFGLTIKNFKLEKEKSMDILMKKFIQDNIEEISKNDFDIQNNIPKRNERLSVTRRISKNTIKAKTNLEKFLSTFRKLMCKIKISNFKIIKLINTSPPKFKEGEFFSCDDLFIKDNNYNVKFLECLIYPSNKYFLSNEAEVLKPIDDENKIIFNKNLLTKNLDKLILKHNYLFDEKYVMKQIFSSGIMESIHLAKSGFFIRCDYTSLGKKLILFRSLFEDDFKFLFENENFQKKENISNVNYINQQLENWKPDQVLINKISSITKINVQDFIFGKSRLFISNKALLNNPNLTNCFDFPRFIIKSMFKNAIKKVKNLKTFQRTFFQILSKRKIYIFSDVIEKTKHNLNLKKFFTNFIKKSKSTDNAIKIIQKNFKRFLFVKNKIIILQKVIRQFFIKIKEHKKRNLIWKILKIDGSNRKLNEILTFDLLKKISLIRHSKGAIINKYFKKHLKEKKLKNSSSKITDLIQKIFNYKNKEIGLHQIKSYFIEIKNISKIQSLFRAKKSINLLNNLKILKIQQMREIGINKIIKSFKGNLTNAFNFFTQNIKYYCEIRCSRATFIKKCYNIHKVIRNRIFNLKFRKSIKNIDFLLDKKIENSKLHFLESLKYLSSIKIKEEKNKNAIKLQNLIRKNKSKKLYQILKKNKEREILEEKLKLFIKKINNFKEIFIDNSKGLFLKNLFFIYKEILRIENNNKVACKLQNLFKRHQSIKKMEKIKFYNFQLQSKCIEVKNLLDNIFKRKNKENFFFKFNELLKEIEKKNKKAIQIQSLIRFKYAQKNYKNLKEENIKKIEIIKKNLTNFCLTTNKNIKYLNEQIFLSNLKEKIIVREKNSITIQKYIRKINALRFVSQLRKEREIYKNKLINFIYILEKITLNYKKRELKSFLEKIKKFIKGIHNVIKLQSYYRKYISFIKSKKLKEIKLKELENQRLQNIAKAIGKIDNLHKTFLNFNSLHGINNLKLKLSIFKKYDNFTNLLDNFILKKKNFLLNESSQIIKNYTKLKNINYICLIRKIQKNYYNYIKIKKEKTRLIEYNRNTKKLYIFLENIFNDKLNEFKKYSYQLLKINYYHLKQIVKIQINFLKSMAIKKLNLLRENRQIFIKKAKVFSNKIVNLIENSNKSLKKDSFKQICYKYERIKKLILIQSNIRKFFAVKNLRSLKYEIFLNKINKSIFILEKYITDKKLKTKYGTLLQLKDHSVNVQKLIKIQNKFRINQSKNLFEKLRNEEEIKKSKIRKHTYQMFISRIISILESSKIKKKYEFINQLAINRNFFNKKLFIFKQNSSIRKIVNLLKKFVTINTSKRNLLKNLINVFISINTNKKKILRLYFNKYKKNSNIFGLIALFINKLQITLILNKYLRKKYFKILADFSLNKKVAKSILKKSFFKQYRKIVMKNIKREYLSFFSEFAKIYSSIHKNKNCKTKSTNDTFSVIYSNISIVDNYMTNNENNIVTRKTATPLNKLTLNDVKINKSNEDTKKNNDNRLTINQNPLKNSKNSQLKENKKENSKAKINNFNSSKKISSNLLNNKNSNLLEKNKTNLIINKNQKKYKSKSPIPKPVKKNDLLDNLIDIPKIPLNKEENNLNNFFSNSNESNIFESKENIENLQKLVNETKIINEVKKNNLNSTRKCITNFKQNNTQNIKNFLNSDKKIQNELDSLTDELDNLLKDAGNLTNSSNMKNKIKNVNINIGDLNESEMKIDYWKKNTEYRRNQLKKIENPLDTDFRKLNIEDENEDLKGLKENQKGKFLNYEVDYEKLTFKRECFTDFPKSKK